MPTIKHKKRKQTSRSKVGLCKTLALTTQ